MTNNATTGGPGDTQRLADLVQRFQQAPHSTTEERFARDQMLDELQDMVGLSGRMATEADIIRRATKLLQGQ